MGDRLRPNRGGVSQGLVQGCYRAVPQAWQCSGSPLWAGRGGEDWQFGQKSGTPWKFGQQSGTPWLSPLHHQPLTHLPLLASVTVALPFPAPNLPPHLLLASATAAVSTSTESECELLITRQLVWHKLVLLCHFPPHSGLQGWRVDCCKIWDCCHFRSNNCNL